MLITRPEESYRLWCIVLCDIVTLGIRRQWPLFGHGATREGVGETYFFLEGTECSLQRISFSFGFPFQELQISIWTNS